MSEDKDTPEAPTEEPKVEITVSEAPAEDSGDETSGDEGETAAAPIAPLPVITESEAIERTTQRDALGRSYATGRRKNAVARVWIKPGRGNVTVNGKDQSVYFARQTQRLILNQPFLISGQMGQFDVVCTVKGGGLSGQAGAVRHAISRALQNYDPELRPPLKKAGMLRRDARMVERKKVGLHKARRSKQWAKR